MKIRQYWRELPLWVRVSGFVILAGMIVCSAYLHVSQVLLQRFEIFLPVDRFVVLVVAIGLGFLGGFWAVACLVIRARTQ